MNTLCVYYILGVDILTEYFNIWCFIVVNDTAYVFGQVHAGLISTHSRGVCTVKKQKTKQIGNTITFAHVFLCVCVCVN